MIFANVKKLLVPEGQVKQIDSGGIVLWKSGHTNLVPASIDSDGSIFNGKGYRDGYRLSSSGGLSSMSGGCVTGFIPVRSADLIRMAGVSWYAQLGYCYLAFYDSGFAVLGSINMYYNADAQKYASTSRGIVKQNSTSDDTAYNYPSESNGVYTFDQYVFTSAADAARVAYFRINGYGSGADMIVSVNEEIEL